MRVWELDAAEWMPSFHIRVAVGRKRAVKIGRAMGMGNVSVSSDASATYEEGGGTALVYVSKRAARDGGDQLAALAAHEAVHCADAWCASIGEDSPASEEYAYMVQACALTILAGVRAELERGAHGR